MGMMHFTSGKNGYNYYARDPSILRIPKEKLVEILKLEDSYRSSEEYQTKYSQQDDLSRYRDVTLEIQNRALLETGLTEAELETGLQELWSTRGSYEDDDEVNSLTVYQRKDRSRAGDLSNTSPVPNAPLRTLAGEETDLKTYCASLKNPHLPLFLIGGSVS